ncbi:MAG TPA: DUF1127 domain-containing protein [Stellaceae bacterium]|nr:DUF1127 domain-containing protein [Stellaceae bacterium]
MFVVNLLAAAKAALSEWRRKQQAYAELSALDDRSLADIGINRSQIPAIVEGFHEASQKPHDRELVPAFSTYLAGNWFPRFPPL